MYHPTSSSILKVKYELMLTFIFKISALCHKYIFLCPGLYGYGAWLKSLRVHINGTIITSRTIYLNKEYNPYCVVVISPLLHIELFNIEHKREPLLCYTLSEWTQWHVSKHTSTKDVLLAYVNKHTKTLSTIREEHSSTFVFEKVLMENWWKHKVKYHKCFKRVIIKWSIANKLNNTSPCV